MGRFAINFFATWIVAFVLFLRGFLLNSTPKSFASLFRRRVGGDGGGRCGRVPIISGQGWCRALFLYFCLLGKIGGGLLIKIRQNPGHHKERSVVFQVLLGVFVSLCSRSFGLDLSIPFRRVNNCLAGHWHKALCCEVIHFVEKEKMPQCFFMTFRPKDTRPFNSVDPFVWCWRGSSHKQTHFALLLPAFQQHWHPARNSCEIEPWTRRPLSFFRDKFPVMRALKTCLDSIWKLPSWL